MKSIVLKLIAVIAVAVTRPAYAVTSSDFALNVKPGDLQELVVQALPAQPDLVAAPIAPDIGPVLYAGTAHGAGSLPDTGKVTTCGRYEGLCLSAAQKVTDNRSLPFEVGWRV